MAKIFSLEERVEYFKQFGSHCMAYSTLQPGMEYFDMRGVGYLAYMTKDRTCFVLGDPVCDENNEEKIAGEFLNEHKDVCFYKLMSLSQTS